MVLLTQHRFGTACKGHERFIYDDGSYLLAMALADGALAGIKSVDELEKKKITGPEDYLILRFEDEALERPILRKCTQADGVTEQPMPSTAFLDIWRSTLVNAGYIWGPSVHAVRRSLGKAIDGTYQSSEASGASRGSAISD